MAFFLPPSTSTAIASTSTSVENRNSFYCDMDFVLSPKGNDISDQSYDYFEGCSSSLSVDNVDAFFKR